MADSRDEEITFLRQQVSNLSEALARVSQIAAAPPPAPAADAYKPSGFVMIDSGPHAGQYVRAPITDRDVGYIRAEGFRWDGNTPVFPPHWPKHALGPDGKPLPEGATVV